MFKTDNPVATHRCTTDLRKLWQVSTVLKDLRKGDLLNLKTKEGLLLHYKIKFITIIDSSKNTLQLKSQENDESVKVQEGLRVMPRTWHS